MKRIAYTLSTILKACVALVFAAVLTTLIILAGGPTSFDFIAPSLSSWFNQYFPQARVTFGDIVLNWSVEHRYIGLEIQSLHIELRDERIDVATTHVSLSIPALVRGNIIPSSLNLINPLVHIDGKDAPLSSTSRTLQHFNGKEILKQFMDHMPSHDAGTPDTLQYVAITDGIVTIANTDRIGLMIQHFNAYYDNITRHVSMEGHLDMLMHNNALITFAGDYNLTTRFLSAQMELSDLPLFLIRKELAQNAIVLPEIQTKDTVSLNGEIAFAVTLEEAEPRLNTITFDLHTMDATHLTIPDMMEMPLHIEELHVAGLYEPQEHRIAVQAFDVSLQQPVDFTIEEGAKPVSLRRMNIAGDVMLDDETNLPMDFHIKQGTMETNLASVRIQGTIATQEQTYVATLQPSIETLSVSVPDLRDYAPHMLADLEDVKGGNIHRATATLSLHTDGERTTLHTIKGSFDLQDGIISWDENEPMIVEIGARVHFTDEAVTVQITKARSEDDMIFHDGALHITGMDGDNPVVVLRSNIDAPLRTVMELSERWASDSEEQPFIISADKSAITGRVLGDVTVRFSPGKTASNGGDNAPHVTASGVIRDAHMRAIFPDSIPEFLGDLELRNAFANFHYDKENLEIIGTGTLSNIPMNFSWHHDNIPSTNQKTDKGQFSFQVQDIPTRTTPLERYLLEGNMLKGQTTIDIIMADMLILDIQSQDFSGRIGVETADYTPEQTHFTLSSLRYEDNHFSASITVNEKTDYMTMDIVADHLSVPSLIALNRRFSDSLGNDIPKTVSIDIIAENIAFGNEHPLQGIQGNIIIEEAQVRYANLQSTSVNNPSGAMTLLIAPDSKDPTLRTLTLHTDQAGEFLRRANIFNTMSDGLLEISGTLSANSAITPHLFQITITAFKVQNTPFLGSLLSFVSLTGLFNQLIENGIYFTQFNADIQYQDGILYFKDAVSAGESLGITGSGNIDITKGIIDIVGEISPAYFINNRLNNIPVINVFLGNDPKSGLIMGSYSAKGDLKDPSFTFNPLITIVPGLIRRLLNQPTESLGPASSAPQN